VEVRLLLEAPASESVFDVAALVASVVVTGDVADAVVIVSGCVDSS
jgi:hypothetical protein